MILIALGANLPSRFGTPEQTLEAAYVEMQRRGVRVLSRSSVWRSAPVPVSDQPWYKNAVAVVETALDIPKLLSCLKAIEEDFGRVEAVRNAPRLLDLDIIAYDDFVHDEDDIVVPHPRAHERAFVLYPLREVAPDWVHPVLRCSVDDLIGVLPTEQNIERQTLAGAK